MHEIGKTAKLLFADVPQYPREFLRALKRPELKPEDFSKVAVGTKAGSIGFIGLTIVACAVLHFLLGFILWQRLPDLTDWLRSSAQLIVGLFLFFLILSLLLRTYPSEETGRAALFIFSWSSAYYPFVVFFRTLSKIPGSAFMKDLFEQLMRANPAELPASVHIDVMLVSIWIVAILASLVPVVLWLKRVATLPQFLCGTHVGRPFLRVVFAYAIFLSMQIAVFVLPMFLFILPGIRAGLILKRQESKVAIGRPDFAELSRAIGSLKLYATDGELHYRLTLVQAAFRLAGNRFLLSNDSDAFNQIDGIAMGFLSENWDVSSSRFIAFMERLTNKHDDISTILAPTVREIEEARAKRGGAVEPKTWFQIKEPLDSLLKFRLFL